MSQSRFSPDQQLFSRYTLTRQISSHPTGIEVWSATNDSFNETQTLLILPDELSPISAVSDNLSDHLKDRNEPHNLPFLLTPADFRANCDPLLFELSPLPEDAVPVSQLDTEDKKIVAPKIDHAYQQLQEEREVFGFNFPELIFHSKNDDTITFLPPVLLHQIIDQFFSILPEHPFRSELGQLADVQRPNVEHDKKNRHAILQSLGFQPDDTTEAKPAPQTETTPLTENRQTRKIIAIASGAAFALLVIVLAIKSSGDGEDQENKYSPTPIAFHVQDADDTDQPADQPWWQTNADDPATIPVAPLPDPPQPDTPQPAPEPDLQVVQTETPKPETDPVPVKPPTPTDPEPETTDSGAAEISTEPVATPKIENPSPPEIPGSDIVALPPLKEKPDDPQTDSRTNPVDSRTNPVDSRTNPVDSRTNPVDSRTNPVRSKKADPPSDIKQVQGIAISIVENRDASRAGISHYSAVPVTNSQFARVKGDPVSNKKNKIRQATYDEAVEFLDKLTKEARAQNTITADQKFRLPTAAETENQSYWRKGDATSKTEQKPFGFVLTTSNSPEAKKKSTPSGKTPWKRPE